MEQNFGIEVNYGNNIGYLGSPRYGIYNPYPIDYLYQLVNSSSAMWSPYMANGIRRTPLEPRTLPNGVSNGLYQQNVSSDFLLTSNLANSYITATINVDIVRFPRTAFLNSSTWLSGSEIDGRVLVNGSEEISNANSDNVASIGKHYKDASNIHFIVAKGAYANLADAQTRFPSQLTRYQLATPIDTLNSPFTNPVIDLSGVLGKNEIDMFSVGNVFVTTSFVGNKLRFGAINGSSLSTPYFKNINFKSNTQYTISGIWSQPSTNNQRFRFIYTDGTSTNQGTAPTGTPTAFSFTSQAGKTVDYVAIAYSAEGSYTEIENLQLELGSVATAYEPYGKTNLLLNGFGAIPTSGYTEVVCKNIGQEGSYANLVTNGDFSQGTTGWTADSSSLSVVGGNLNAIGSGVASICGTYKVITGYRNTNKRIARKVRARVLDTANSLFIFSRDGNGGTVIGGVTIPSPVVNQWYEIELSEIITTPVSFVNDLNIFIRANYADAATANGKRIEIDYVQLVEITDNPLVQYLEPRLGRQLTVAECDYLFSFTPTTATVKAKLVPFLQFDGINDYGVANHPALDIVGTGDFAIECVFKTGATIPTVGYFLSKAESLITTQQYGLYLRNDGSTKRIRFALQNDTLNIAIGFVVENTIYSLLVYRESGVLKSRLTKIETYNQSNTTNIVTKPHFRLGARSSAVGGDTNTEYINIALGHLSITNGDLTPFTEADLIAKFDKYCLTTFGI